VKLADDRSGDVVVRLYESLGGRAAARITAGFDVAGAEVVDLLERPAPDLPTGDVGLRVEGRHLSLALRPFQIVTLRIGRP
jgi:alpha-mannosidase